MAEANIVRHTEPMTTLTESCWSADTSLELTAHTVGSLLGQRAGELAETTALVVTAHDGMSRR